MAAAGVTLLRTVKFLTSQPKVWLPFLLVAGVEAFGIGLLWLAAHPPVSHLLAPPIRYLFGDRALHYPWHLWFLYHAMKHTHLVASTLVGAFMTGIVCVMVRQAFEAQPVSLRMALVSRQVRYRRVVAVWLISWAVAQGLLRTLAPLIPDNPWRLWALVGCTVVLQMLVVYAIPAAVFEGSAWWKALLQGARETLRHPLSTLLVILIPSSAVMACSILAAPSRVAQWMSQTTPELALVFVLARLIIWTVADAVMTVAVAHLWWLHRSAGVATQAAHAQAGALATGPSSPRLALGAFKGGPAVA